MALVLRVRPFTEPSHALVFGLVAALLLANFNPEVYHALQHAEMFAGLNLHYLVLDVLMTLFFFLVGAELKIDFTDHEGAFRNFRNAIAPAVGALGGVAMPALICLLLAGSWGTRAFGIPMATDIAFTLIAAKALGMTRPELAFLKALAVIDDIIGILVIAVFYGSSIHFGYLALAVAVGLVVWKAPVQSTLFYWGALVVLWLLLHHAGIHPTLAGVVVGLSLPHGVHQGHTVARKMEHQLSSWMMSGVLLLFGLVSCGIVLGPSFIEQAQTPVAMGVAFGLLVGKPVGVFGILWVLHRYWPVLTPVFGWHRLAAAATLCGIGFTVALFVNDLAFGPGMVETEYGRIGVVLGSLAATVAGAAVTYLTRAYRQEPVRHHQPA